VRLLPRSSIDIVVAYTSNNDEILWAVVSFVSWLRDLIATVFLIFGEDELQRHLIVALNVL